MRHSLGATPSESLKMLVKYAASLVAEGVTDIMKFGIAFFAKRAAIAK